MCKRVEEWQGRVGVECWSMGRNQRVDTGQRWERLREDIPRLSYSWEDMQTEALFWAGKAKFDSRI